MIWVDIPGFYFRYQISDTGVVRKVMPDGTVKIMAQFKKNKVSVDNSIVVSLTVKPGNYRQVRVASLMADAFMGGRDKHPGMCVAHKNGCVSDNELCNLEWVTPHENGKRNGGTLRQAVSKIDRDGNIVHIYKSETEAARKEFISRKCIHQRIKRRIEGDEFALTGYTYRKA